MAASSTPHDRRGAVTGEVTADPSRSERFRAVERRIASVSHVLDDLVAVPGGQRVGIDPIVGLIPVVGDVIPAIVSFWIILEAARFRLPRIVLARMVVNAGVDLVIGAIPLLGDLFDFVSKPNAKNLELFRRHALEPEVGTGTERRFFVGLLLLLAGILGLLVWLIGQLIGWLQSIELSIPGV